VVKRLQGAGTYPIIGSYSQRSFDVGIRQRGAAVAIQVTTNVSYAAPTTIPV
jgi:hypothetical protein